MLDSSDLYGGVVLDHPDDLEYYEYKKHMDTQHLYPLIPDHLDIPF